MREMILMADGTSRKIAVAVGVSTITVQRERKRMLEGRNNRECALSVSATDRGHALLCALEHSRKSGLESD